MRDGPAKNPFSSVSDLLSRASPSKRGARFIAYIIDLLFVAIVSYLLFLGGEAITRNNSAFKKNNARYNEEITYYQDMLVDAHLAEYVSRDKHVLYDDEDLSIKMAINQILLSYSYDDPESPEFPTNPAEELKKYYRGSFYDNCYVNADYNNDYIAQFFIDYVPLHNQNNDLIDFKDKTPTVYFLDFFKRHASDYEKMRFIYHVDEVTGDTDFPRLRVDIAYSIYRYLVRDKGYNRDCYDAFVNFYTSMLSDTEDVIFQSESYRSVHYRDYLNYRKQVVQALNYTLIISIALAYYLVVFTPQMIFKDGRSLGKIFIRLASINIDKSETEIWKNIVRSIFAAIMYIHVAFFLVLLPPFNGSSLILLLPFIGELTFLNIILIIFIVFCVNGIFILFTHERRSLTDLIFKTITVDVTLLDEPDYDEKDEANS